MRALLPALLLALAWPASALDLRDAYALALRLVPGHDWSLTLAPAPAEATPAAWPHALGLLRALHLDLPRIQHHWKSRTWTWQRNRP